MAEDNTKEQPNGSRMPPTVATEQQQSPPPPPTRPGGRRVSHLPAKGLSSRFSMRIPATHEVEYTAAETHGVDHYKVKLLQFLHSPKVQLFFMLLLMGDVIILFIEMFLQSQYPVCQIIVRDAISCCPPAIISGSMMEYAAAGAYYSANATNLDNGGEDHHFLRLLSEDAEEAHHGEEDHHSFCESPALDSYEYEAACDPHKWTTVHTVERVLFAFTITILSIFLLELVTMAMILQANFFRQFFYVLDLFIVATSLTLELLFHFLHKDILTSLAGFLVFFRVWRFVRIGHGIIEVTAEYAGRDKEAIMEYAEQLEKILQDKGVELPEPNPRVGYIKQQMESERKYHGHSNH